MDRLLENQKGIQFWVEMLIPVNYLSDERSLRKARLLVLFYLSTAIFLGAFAALYHLVGYSLGVWACHPDLRNGRHQFEHRPVVGDRPGFWICLLRLETRPDDVTGLLDRNSHTLRFEGQGNGAPQTI